MLLPLLSLGAVFLGSFLQIVYNQHYAAPAIAALLTLFYRCGVLDLPGCSGAPHIPIPKQFSFSRMGHRAGRLGDPAAFRMAPSATTGLEA
jgi:hypothetical protein